MKSRFKPHTDSAVSISEKQFDPEFDGSESHDLTEYQFAASLEQSSDRPHFEVANAHDEVRNVNDTAETRDEKTDCDPRIPKQEEKESQLSSAPIADDGKAWRQEVTAKLTNYKARRGAKEPRYPSLQLKFEDREWARPSQSSELKHSVLSSEQLEDIDRFEIPPLQPPFPQTNRKTRRNDSPQAPLFESTARIIEFPRSSNAPPIRVEDLADPIFDRPRIIEAPEISPPPPALGGILIEPAEAPANEKRPGFEMPLQSARMGRRLGATVIDAAIVLASLTLSGYVFWRLTNTVPAPRLAEELVGTGAVVLWSAYQYLLIVHCGTTPGLKLTKLQLNRFDGSLVPRKLRRWRVLASMLSGLSLSLGYAWCFLDEDQLCWHDRITRTYMAPKP